MLALAAGVAACDEPRPAAEGEAAHTAPPRNEQSGSEKVAGGEDRAERETVQRGPLPLGEAVEERLPPATCHEYTIDLEAGQAFRFEVEQRGVDVSTRVVDPGGSELVVVDSLMGAFGREDGVAVAARSGTLRLEVCPSSTRALGSESYRLAAERGAATAADGATVEALHAYRDARRLHYGGSVDKALPHYQEALDRWRAVGSARGEAWTLHALGKAWMAAGEWGGAEEALGLAVTLYERLGERYAASRPRLDLITVHRKRGDLEAAERCADLALEVGREYADPEVIWRAREGRAFVLYEQGRAAESIRIVQDLLAAAREAGDQERQIELLRAVGTACLGAGDYESALDLFSDTLRRSTGSGQEELEAELRQDLGRAYYEVDRLDEATRELELALDLYQRAANRSNVAQTLNLLGRVAQKRGSYSLAGERFQKALAQFEQLRDRPGQASALINLGQHHNLTDGPKEALEQCRRALEISREIKRPALEASARYCIARAHYQLGQFETALEEARLCEEVAEDLRRQKSHAGQRATYADRKRHYYELPVTLHLAMAAADPAGHHRDLAFAAAEAARARTLLELLRMADVDPRSGLAPEDREELERIEHSLDELHRERILRLRDSERLEEIERELSELSDQLERKEGEIRGRHPAYAEMTKPAAISLDEVQSELPPGTQLLAYFVGEDASWLWLIDGGSSQVRRLPPAEELEAAARETHRRLALSSNRTYREASKREATRLAEMILGPVAEQLRGPRLAIVADGALHYIPFAALPLPGAAPAEGEGPVLLVDRFDIVYPPSIAVVRALRAQRRQAAGSTKSAVILGDPVHSAHDPRAGGDGAVPEPASDGVCAALPRLEYSKDEARTITEMIPGAELRLGFAADREWIRDGGLAGAGIVHFATHACIDPRRPDLSGIALSMVDRRGRPVDGMLRGHEIFGLDLAADLVVVSACSSGLGPEVRGEGLLGITRGFMYAGVPQVVVSLWDVDDQATAELMQRFYRGMFERDLDPAAALAEAQRDMALDPVWTDPANWAGFVLQGDWQGGR